MTLFAPFTCLLPVCERDDPLAFNEAASSIFANTLQPQSVLLCVDGPLPEELRAMVNGWASKPTFHIVENAGARGLQHNLNNAAAHVETPWICRADADDVNLPSRFAIQFEWLMANPQIDVLGTAITEFFPDGTTRVKTSPANHAEIVAYAARRNPVNHMTAFVRSGLFRAVGGYPDISLREDYALWLTMLAAGAKFANLAEPLVNVRMGSNFYERRSGLRHIAAESQLASLKSRMEDIGPGIAMSTFLMRSAVLICGPSITRFVYERFLR